MLFYKRLIILEVITEVKGSCPLTVFSYTIIHSFLKEMDNFSDPKGACPLALIIVSFTNE